MSDILKMREVVRECTNTSNVGLRASIAKKSLSKSNLALLIFSFILGILFLGIGFTMLFQSKKPLNQEKTLIDEASQMQEISHAS